MLVLHSCRYQTARTSHIIDPTFVRVGYRRTHLSSSWPTVSSVLFVISDDRHVFFSIIRILRVSPRRPVHLFVQQEIGCHRVSTSCYRPCPNQDCWVQHTPDIMARCSLVSTVHTFLFDIYLLISSATASIPRVPNRDVTTPRSGLPR